LNNLKYPFNILKDIYCNDIYKTFLNYKYSCLVGSMDFITKTLLTDKQQDYLLMRYKFGMKLKDISEIKCVTCQTIDVSIKVSLNKLKSNNVCRLLALKLESGQDDLMLIENMPLSAKLISTLLENNIKTVKDVLNMKPYEFWKAYFISKNDKYILLKTLESFGFNINILKTYYVRKASAYKFIKYPYNLLYYVDCDLFNKFLFDDTEVMIIAADLLDLLTDEEREVIEYRFIKCLKFHDMGVELGLSYGGIKHIMNSSIDIMRMYIKNYLELKCA